MKKIDLAKSLSFGISYKNTNKITSKKDSNKLINNSHYSNDNHNNKNNNEKNNEDKVNTKVRIFFMFIYSHYFLFT